MASLISSNSAIPDERIMGFFLELTPKTIESRNAARSLFVIKNIYEGEVFTENNLKSIRPGYGLSPKYYKDILGKKAKENIQKGTPLSWDLID